jgi:hypothetical protein
MLRRILGFTVLTSLFLFGGVFADPVPPPSLPTLSSIPPTPVPTVDTFTPQYGQYILTAHDKFQLQTTVCLDPNFVNRESEWAPILFAPGKLLFNDPNGKYTHIGFNIALTVPDAGSDSQAQTIIGLYFRNRAAGWEHRGDHDFYWLVDGKPMTWIGVAYQKEIGAVTSYGNNNYLETNFVQITPDQLKQLAQAKVIDCRFGSVEFYFGGIQFWLLRKFSQAYDNIILGQGPPPVPPN